MDLNQYQVSTRATSPGKRDRSPEDDARLLPVFGLGVAGEAGEVADLIKKHVGHGHPLDVSKLKYELGDVLWYVAALADICGLTLDDVAAANIEKLRARYPDGFSSERSIHRVPHGPPCTCGPKTTDPNCKAMGPYHV